MDLCVGTSVYELKGHWAGYAEKEEINLTGIMMNRYICGHAEQFSDEQIHLWTCRTVETLTGRSKRLIGMKISKCTGRTMNGYKYEQVHM